MFRSNRNKYCPHQKIPNQVRFCSFVLPPRLQAQTHYPETMTQLPSPSDFATSSATDEQVTPIMTKQQGEEGEVEEDIALLSVGMAKKIAKECATGRFFISGATIPADLKKVNKKH